MWTYNWFRKNTGWHPQIVDNLTMEQEFWFPILDQAESIASAQLNPNKE